MTFDCPYCGQNLEADFDLVGQSVKCPSCENDIVVPRAFHASKPPERLRNCPFCSEQIKAAAIKCKHCGSMLDGSTGRATNRRSNVPVDYEGEDVPRKKQEISTGVLVASYILAFLIPLIGLIMSIYLLIRGRLGHFLATIAVSISMWSFWEGFWWGFWISILDTIIGEGSVP